MILAEFLVVLYADHLRFHPRHPYNYRESTDSLIGWMYDFGFQLKHLSCWYPFTPSLHNNYPAICDLGDTEGRHLLQSVSSACAEHGRRAVAARRV